jgi:hypothetical protein
MIAACQEGQLDVAFLMISMGADAWDRGLSSACRDGHRELAELMIFQGCHQFELCNALCMYGGPP